MNLKRIIREEIDELSWIRDLDPIPEQIKMIPNLPIGGYKVWLGDIPKELQIAVLKYLIDIGENSESIQVSSIANQILFGVTRDNYEINSLYFNITNPNDILSPIKKKINVTMMAVYPEDSELGEGLTREQQLDYCRDYYDYETKEKQEITPSLNESEDDDWEWARTTQPVELEKPENWVGRSFGYGQPIIDQMDDEEIERGDSEEIFTILGVDENGNLPLLKHHPLYGDSYDSTTSPLNLRNYISKGAWVWK